VSGLDEQDWIAERVFCPFDFQECMQACSHRLLRNGVLVVRKERGRNGRRNIIIIIDNNIVVNVFVVTIYKKFCLFMM
jgi:hypothetical protein